MTQDTPTPTPTPTSAPEPAAPTPAESHPAPETRKPIRLTFYGWIMLTIIAVAVALGLVNLALYALKSADLAITGSSGSLLYAAKFRDRADEWSQFEGQMSAQIKDTSLRIVVEAGHDGVFSVAKYDFADFDVRVNATRLSANDTYNEIGLLFRYRDPANYYIFKIRGDGFYRVEKRQDGVTTVLSEWHGSPAVLPSLSTINQLRVVGQGDRFQFYVNDQKLLLCPNGPGKAKSTWNADNCLSNNGQTAGVVQDSTFRSGKIGVGVYVNDPGIEVAFDNVVVYAP